MSHLNAWRCPNCGAVVDLPKDVQANAREKVERSLDRLARVVCGCWVVQLPDREVSRLLDAILVGDDYSDMCGPVASTMRN